jgi:predicted DNA-binding transcriptional regulator AlpA
VGEDLKRFLPPEDVAERIGVRVDQIPRLLKAGKLPKPSFHLGPRKPRYDRIAIDALFTGNKEPDEQAGDAAIVQSIIDRARRQKAAGGRHNQRIPLPTK